MQSTKATIPSTQQRLDALLERRRYCEPPPRHEYVPTGRGRDFHPVLVALLSWGSKHFAPDGASVLLVDKRSGAPAEPILVDRRAGRPITDADHRLAAGPAASDRTRLRYGLPPRTPTRSKAAKANRAG